MRTLLIAMVMSCVPFLAQAQHFDKYENRKDVNEVVITHHMFELLSDVDIQDKDPKVQEMIDLVNSLKEIRIFSTANHSIGANMQTDVQNFVHTADLEKLMKVKKDDNRIVFYSKPGSSKGKVSRLLMFLEGHEAGDPQFVLLSIKGDIDLNKLAKISSVFDFPGADELKNVNTK